MIYLTPQEITRLHKLKTVEGSHAHIRDRFVIGCVTGLRFSDYSRLSLDHIGTDNIIRILTKKRSKPTTIPMHPYIKDILKRNNNNLPPTYSVQYYNQLLPLICMQAGIRSTINIECKLNGIVSLKKGLKYEAVTTHTARRSFATNAYKAGVPVHAIMLITTHATEQDFFRYISVGQEENAAELSNHIFFK